MGSADGSGSSDALGEVIVLEGPPDGDVGSLVLLLVAGSWVAGSVPDPVRLSTTIPATPARSTTPTNPSTRGALLGFAVTVGGPSRDTPMWLGTRGDRTTSFVGYVPAGTCGGSDPAPLGIGATPGPGAPTGVAWMPGGARLRPRPPRTRATTFALRSSAQG